MSGVLVSGAVLIWYLLFGLHCLHTLLTGHERQRVERWLAVALLPFALAIAPLLWLAAAVARHRR